MGRIKLKNILPQRLIRLLDRVASYSASGKKHQNVGGTSGAEQLDP